MLASLSTVATALAIAGGAIAPNVGFSELRIARATDGPLVVGVWYPTAAAALDHQLGPYRQSVALDGLPIGDHLPLVVVSHGNGGSYQNHLDTALALAGAGFVVAAVSHPGDTYNDQSRALMVSERPQHIHRLLDYMLAEWPHRARVDQSRIGMFGFSSGAFTTLILLGGKPDLSLADIRVLQHPESHEAQLRMRASASAVGSSPVDAPPPIWVHDPRIKAAAIAAPALGYTFDAAGLADVKVPIQLWQAENDQVLPGPDYAEAVRCALPRLPEFHSVANADHFDFLAPCTDALWGYAPAICTSRPGFDRSAFHRLFNREIIRFFSDVLR